MASQICVLLGRKIRSLRLDRGWKQIDLATATGINEKYVSDLERAKKEICLVKLELIAHAFEMSPAQLLQGLSPEHSQE
jgi:transcriptional regulator with XRE-family HTH domain